MKNAIFEYSKTDLICQQGYAYCLTQLQACTTTLLDNKPKLVLLYMFTVYDSELKLHDSTCFNAFITDCGARCIFGWLFYIAVKRAGAYHDTIIVLHIILLLVILLGELTLTGSSSKLSASNLSLFEKVKVMSNHHPFSWAFVWWCDPTKQKVQLGLCSNLNRATINTAHGDLFRNVNNRKESFRLTLYWDAVKNTLYHHIPYIIHN